ncbi:MAG: sec-independent protein translocase protein TatC [bacterium F082]|nr:MAG: sec-independent protein translocase protein TatC [bacterium F082]KWW27773.1 MAG: sec-independent protein translocase protein TatC [bacterium P201]
MGGQTFWDHLDALRGVILRILAVVSVAAVVCFCCREWLFAVILAPSSCDFITYRLIERISGASRQFDVSMFNPRLTQQFLIHMKSAFCMGLLIVSPYVIYQIFGFIAPALYRSERRLAIHAVGAGYVMFLIGVALGYFILFPLTFRFLGTYRVSPTVPNIIELSDYTSMLLLLCLMTGLVFELPVVSWLLARMGILKAGTMSHYRRHALVAILIVAAVLTPTGDPFTLVLVSLPVYLLYELSIVLVRRARPDA